MRAQSQLITHRTAQDKERGREAGEFGEAGFEVVSGGIGTENIVEKGAGCYGLKHGWRWGCDDVGAEVEGCGARGGPGVLRGEFRGWRVGVRVVVSVGERRHCGGV